MLKIIVIGVPCCLYLSVEYTAKNIELFGSIFFLTNFLQNSW